MIKKSTLVEAVERQRNQLLLSNMGYTRSLLVQLNKSLLDHALIISGIRRCGKSTLLHQLIVNESDFFLFLNFDTAKLYNFELSDFVLVDELISESACKVLYFDEIQVVKGWEIYIRQKLDEGYRVVLTGSNASLLSKELGTKLTGRHITKELFPFSYIEFCEFMEMPIESDASLTRYMMLGGFPGYLKNENEDIHTALLDDILYRDVAVRHNIRDVQSLKRLLTFLATNVGNLISATKLTQLIGIKSVATVLEYLSYFELSYLIQLVPKFSYSYKVQLVNPRKVYFIDNGLQGTLSGSFNKDLGRKLENLVFWGLRGHQKELFYYNENGKECDFVVCRNNVVLQLIQVCYDLNNENYNREIEGLLDAMNFFQLAVGVILTFNQRDVILRNNQRIDVMPVYEFCKK